ncbi:MAG TPA: adenylate/guanylate cyclase domain-containing protein [Actinomycetota bacterium]|nr:adenylate/guanylate cyclase domain-containing protein [Actinomycetota bacterium]
MAACPNCGSENPEGANFCSVCGARLDAAEASAEVRKIVTIVFCDVTGSTELGERLDPESMRKVMARYFDAMRAALERHGGSVEKFIGDAVMAVFGIPQLHEDDALRAVRAAAEMRSGLDDLNHELERDHGVRLTCRVGVNTGEVLVGAESSDFGRMTGDAVNTAARLEAAAEPGQILIGDDTYRLVRDAVLAEPVEPLSLKGKAEPVPAHRLIEVVSEIGQSRRALTSTMVGRDRELEDLTRAFARAAEDRSCLLFTILGAAGEGKTRLVEEFLSSVDGSASVVRGRCLPYGEGITYWPVAEAVRTALGVQAFDPPEHVAARLGDSLAGDQHARAIAGRLAEILGFGEGLSAPEETPWAIRRFLEILAAQRPLIALWEDIHWAEPAFLDCVNHVVDWSRDAPIMMLCTARPEFLDGRADWGGGKLNASTLLLRPLEPKDSAELIANLLGGAGLADEALDRITEAAGGNPLFVEQLLSMLIDDGMLIRQDGSWTASGDLSSVRIPPSVAALLGARLERLSDDERRTIECAAVIGKEFFAGAVRHLLPEALGTSSTELILSLVRKDLVRSERSAVLGEDSFRFRHILIRDAAYQAIPKERRAELHEGFADWIARRGGERAEEADEIVGYHLERAFRYREALGPLDDDARELGRRASERLAAAGQRALGRHDRQAVANLLGRAASLLDPADPARVAMLPDLGIALWEGGSVEEANAIVEEARARAEELGAPELAMHATLAGAFMLSDVTTSAGNRGSPRSDRSFEQIRADSERAIRMFEASGDERGLARAWNLTADVEWDLGHAGAQLAALERALEHAGRVGAPFETAEVLRSATSAIVRGPTRVPEGIAKAEQFVRDFPDNRGVEAYMDHAIAHLRARLGEFDEAREASDRYRAFLLDTGQMIGYWRSAELRFDVEMLAGDIEAALAVAEEGYMALLEKGDRWPYLGEFLGQALLALGRMEEAAEVAEVASSSAIAVERALGLGVLARVRAREGDRAAAEDLIGEAVDIVERTDFLFDRGTVQLDRAEVMELLGRDTEARGARERALELFEEKGDLVSAARTRSLLERG